MGCDIHTYIEYASKPTDGREPYWQSFTRDGGSRNYLMFGILAGVRVSEAQLFAPKGLPEGISFYTSDDHWIMVAPQDHPEWADQDGYCSIESAKRWMESGYSVGEEKSDGSLRRVSNPDHHSHSWLTTSELEQALEAYRKATVEYYAEEEEAPAEWRAMLAAMRSFEEGGDLARLVFWFDN